MTKQDKIKKVMDEFKRGTLKTPDGKVVKSHKQALAIAMSESKDYAEKGDLINHLSVNSTDEALDILKAAGTEDLFEKAKHQDGDMHPNGKWVWVASANGGKGDWRTHGGRAHKKSQAGAAASSGSTSVGTSGTGNTVQPKPKTATHTQVTPAKKSTAPKTDKERLDLQQEYATMSQLIKKPSTSAQRKKEFQDRMKEIEGMGLKVVKGKFQWSDTGTAATPKSTSSSDKPKQQKKLRPVGTGTNGPERRRKETKKSLTMEGVKEDDLKDCKPGSVIKTKRSGNQTPITYTKSSSGKWDYYDGYYDTKDDLTDYEVARHIRSMSDKKLYPGYSTDFSGLK